MFPQSPFMNVTPMIQMIPITPITTEEKFKFDMSPIFKDGCYNLKSAKRDCYKTITPSCGAKLGATTVTGALPSTSAIPSLGLGGISTLTGIGTANTTTADGKTEPPKQTKLPNEIATTAESFKEFVKKQKSLSCDIMRVSIKPLHKVSKEVENLIRSVLTLRGEVVKSRAHSSRLRHGAAKALMAADTRTTNTPVNGTILEGSAPPDLVQDLVSELEQQLLTFRRQMEAADKQLQAQPTMLSEQELTLGIRRMHDSLVALASRLQAVHTQVEAQKEQYLNLRKYVLKDPTNVFESQNTSSNLEQILREADSERKKTKVSFGDSDKSTLTDPRPALGNIKQLAGPAPFSNIGNTSSPYPNESTVGSWQMPVAVAPTLTLQRPPGKRGKQ